MKENMTKGVMWLFLIGVMVFGAVGCNKRTPASTKVEMCPIATIRDASGRCIIVDDYFLKECASWVVGQNGGVPTIQKCAIVEDVLTAEDVGWFESPEVFVGHGGDVILITDDAGIVVYGGYMQPPLALVRGLKGEPVWKRIKVSDDTAAPNTPWLRSPKPYFTKPIAAPETESSE